MSTFNFVSTLRPSELALLNALFLFISKLASNVDGTFKGGIGVGVKTESNVWGTNSLP